MWSAESLAAEKVAAVMCNTYELKLEIFCAPGSEYSRKRESLTTSEERRAEWNNIVEKRSDEILKCLRLPKNLQEKIVGFVLTIGKQMLIWAEHHERIIEISRECSASILNISFICRGVIENRKVAQELMNNKNLSVTQKYKLAALYCLRDHIPVLYRQMTENKRKMLSNIRTFIKQPSLAKFWARYSTGGAIVLLGNKIMEMYALEQSIKEGSLATIEHFFQQIVSRHGNGILVNAAVKVSKILDKIWKDEWALFGTLKRWKPNSYYIDILCFLISKMTEDQQREFLQMDIEGGVCRASEVLVHFLKAPYQNHFLKTAERTWQFLPEYAFARLLQRIIQKIKLKPECYSYGEDKIFDYRKLLRKFWLCSPKRYKRFIFKEEIISYSTTCAKLFTILLSSTEITYEDREIIQLILESANEEDKKRTFHCCRWIDFCCCFIKQENWALLDRIMFTCFSSEEEADAFKRHLSSTPYLMSICKDIIMFGRYGALDSLTKWCNFTEEMILQWKTALSFSVVEILGKRFVADPDIDEVVSFLEWSSLPKHEEKKLMREILCYDGGLQACRELCLSYSLEISTLFCEAYLSPEERVNLKSRLMSTKFLGELSLNFIPEDQLDTVEEILNFCLLSEEEIKELKKEAAYSVGAEVCEYLSLDDLVLNSWEAADKYLTWSFETEKEILDFKKNVLLKSTAANILFKLFTEDEWHRVETFFFWLRLSCDEIKQLEKDAVHYEAPVWLFHLIYCKEGHTMFSLYESKEEAIELFFETFLTNRKSALEFKEIFRRCQEDMEGMHEGIDEVDLVFNSMFDRYLKVFDTRS